MQATGPVRLGETVDATEGTNPASADAGAEPERDCRSDADPQVLGPVLRYWAET